MGTEAKLTNGDYAAAAAAAAAAGESTSSAAFKLVGFKNFISKNPMSDKFSVKRFHHVEFWCSDATNTARRFSWGLGMPIVQKSDLSTGNSTHASYLLRSGQLNFLFTAPYSPSISTTTTTTASIPTFSHTDCRNFTASHGLAVRSIAIEVEDAEIAFSVSVSHGAKPSSAPITLGDNDVVLSEVKLYGDVVLRYVSYKNPNFDATSSAFLPGFEPVEKTSSFQDLDYGIRRLDHAVGNVPELSQAVDYVKSFTGFHEFAEFTAEDVGTSESGLNSVVLACNSEMVLIPMNEPVYGTKRKSQIQTYLEHNEGAGVQHLALASEDIFRTLREMRKRSGVGGFEFMPSPPPTYYRNLKKRAGDVLSDEQIKECEELGILVDRDDQGTLLQIFTKPVGDRFCNAGLPSDLTIVINGVNFHLHKFPLLSRSGKIEKLIKETQNNDKGTWNITLEEMPGGINGFLVAAKFCYGVHVELTPRNIVMVYCLADYLEMIDEYGDDNLLSIAENYFHKNVLKNWKDCMVALQSCETVITRVDNLQIISKCLNAISTMVCTDPSLFGWPMMMYGRLQSPGGSILWNGINTGARIQCSESDWWFDDVSHLRVSLFEKLIKTMEAKGIQPEKLTGAVMYYCGKCLHGLNRWQGKQITKTRSITRFSTKSDMVDQRVVLESIVELLPQTKGKSICRFLLRLLRVGLILGVSDKCRDSLERRIGMQLELATLDGLMIPTYSDSDTLYNTICVERMINYFLTYEQMGSIKGSPSCIPLRNVSKLVDSYMAEIASDVNLKPEKIHSLAKALPGSSRSLNDGIYRALDIYFEAHPWLPEKEKEHLCNSMDCQKLSIDACAHASQNKRLPLRFVLQVLFFEQMHLKTALAGCLNVVDTENNHTDSMAIVPHGCTGSVMASQIDSWVTLMRENQLLRVGMERMRIRVQELEEEFNQMRQEMKRMSQSQSSLGSPRFLAKTLGVCKLLPRVSDAQRDAEKNGSATPRVSIDQARASHQSKHSLKS